MLGQTAMESIISGYFSEIDISLEKLSHKFEQNITDLPSWLLSPREITIGGMEGADFYVIKAMPNERLEADKLEEVSIRTDDELHRFVAPFKPTFGVRSCPKDPFCLMVSDFRVMEEGRIDALPVSEFNGLLCFVSGGQIPIEFSPEKARKAALDFWNNAAHGLARKSSFLYNLR